VRVGVSAGVVEELLGEGVGIGVQPSLCEDK
jgi:hypothetical protein